MLSVCAMSSSSKPLVAQKPRNPPPPPVPLRIPRQPSQQQQTTTTTGSSLPAAGPTPPLDSDYPMNATWLFHAPAGGAADIGSSTKRSEWIKDRKGVDLPPKMCLKSVPVLPVKPPNNSSVGVKLTKPEPAEIKDASGPTATTIAPRRDLNFTNEIKSRCSQRLTERLPPQVHYNKVSWCETYLKRVESVFF